MITDYKVTQYKDTSIADMNMEVVEDFNVCIGQTDDGIPIMLIGATSKELGKDVVVACGKMDALAIAEKIIQFARTLP